MPLQEKEEETLTRRQDLFCLMLIRSHRVVHFKTMSALFQIISGFPYSRSVELADSTFDLDNLCNNHTELDTECVLEILNKLEDKPVLAFSFFRKSNEQGYCHDIRTYAAILAILCKCKLEGKLSSLLLGVIMSSQLGFSASDLLSALLERLGNGNPGLLVQAYDAFMRFFVSVDMIDEAINALLKAIRHENLPHLYLCNSLLNKLVKFNKDDIAVVVYQQLHSLGLTPNDYTYATVIESLCKKGYLEAALNIFEEMEQAGVIPSAFSCNTYIRGLCLHRKPELGYKLLKRWRNAGIPIGALAYTSVLGGFCFVGMLDDAEDILIRMEKDGFAPTVRNFSPLIICYSKNNMIQQALALHNIMLTRGIKSNRFIVASILQCMAEMGMTSNVINHFKYFRDLGILVDGVCYNIAVQALCNLGKVEEAVILLREMEDRKVVLDVVHYTTLIQGYCSLGKLRDALALLKQMNDLGFKPYIIAYNIVVGSFCRMGLIREAFNLVNYMKTLGLKPDSDTHNFIIENLCAGGKVKMAEAYLNNLEDKCWNNYSALIYGYCETKHTKKGFDLFLSLSKKGLSVTRKSCFRLLKQLCLEGENLLAFQLFKFLVDSDMSPGRPLHKRLIASLCRAQNMVNAEFVFNILASKGPIFDEYTYEWMIHGFCKKEQLTKAFNILNDMKEKGLKPCVSTYTAMLACETKVDLWHDPTILDEIAELGFQPDVVCYNVLIDRMCKMGSVADAIAILYQMIEAGVEPDTVIFITLLNGFCRRNELDKFVIFMSEMLSKGRVPNSCSISKIHKVTLKARKKQFL